MARQGFFDSTTVTEDPVTGLPVGDKAEGSDFLADTLYAILGNGVSMTPTSNLLVSPSTGLIVRLKAGKLWKNGYKLWEEADRDITFTSSASEQTFYISGRLDVASGEFTHGEVYPYTTFVSATDVCVAKIVIPANALTITDAMITDYRYSTTYCGVVDEYRLQLESIAADFETALAELESVGIPNHAATHEPGGDDPAKFVYYGGAQTLTAAQKAQAAANIGAASLENGVVKAAQAKVLIEAISGNFTLTAARSEKLLVETSSSASVVTLPADSSIAAGAAFTVARFGAGTVTFSAESGMTIASPNNVVAISAIFASAVAIKLDSTTWWLICG